MKRKLLGLLCFAAVVLTAAGGALSARVLSTGGTVADRAGDSGRAPDVAQMIVGSKLGLIIVDVTVQGRPSGLANGEAILVGLDADNNPATGSPRGLEFLIERTTESSQAIARFYRWNATTRSYASDPSFGSSFRRDWDIVASPLPNTSRFLVRRTLLDIGSAFGVLAITDTTAAPDTDAVPEIGTLSVPDTEKPVLKALATVGNRGAVAKLTYKVSDDSGKSTESITVFRGTKALASLPGVLGPALGKTYHFRWKVPKSVRKGTKLRFCVTSADEAGNRSGPSCAALKIR